MHCCDTDSQLPAVHCEHLDAKAVKELNRLIGILKRGFLGNAQITLILTGGKVDTMQTFIPSFPDEK